MNFQRGQDLEKKITSIPGFHLMFSGTHFNEFVVQCDDAEKTHTSLLQHGMQGGLLLESEYPELKNCMLFGITELHRDDHIQRLLSLLREVA
jgi:glycine dehydrogenase subunit 1